MPRIPELGPKSNNSDRSAPLRWTGPEIDRTVNHPFTQDTMPTVKPTFIRVTALDELREQGVAVIRGLDRPIAVFYHDGKISAVDNRCPHMGFPMHQGTVKDGMVTCHWHQANSTCAAAVPLTCSLTIYRHSTHRFATGLFSSALHHAKQPRKLITPIGSSGGWNRTSA